LFCCGTVNFSLLMFGCFIIIFSKRAITPFSSWLPLAIVAPTPISALVHSSTLVTAGVVLFLKLRFFLFDQAVVFLFYMSFFSMFFGGLKGCLEIDYKKVIAYSTISQIRIMLLVGTLNLKCLVFLHLIIHASFKFLLFMLFGKIILSGFGRQDIRFNLWGGGVLIVVFCFCCISGLLGVFLVCGAVSKELILINSFLVFKDFFQTLFLALCFMFTIFYSMRLLRILFSFRFLIGPIRILSILNFFPCFFVGGTKIDFNVLEFLFCKIC